MFFISQRINITAIGAIALSVVTAACSPPNLTESADRNSNASVAAVQELKIAVIPDRAPEIQRQELQELETYLETALGIPTDFEVTPDYKTSIQLIVEEQVEMAYLGPFSYVQAKDQNPDIEPLVTHIEQSTGRPWYTGVIVADTSQGITTLEDLRGKRFGFVSQSSTSGYLVPSAQFQEMGIDPEEDFAAIAYSGSHDKNATALAQGEVDAIAIEETTYQRAKASGELAGDRYVILWQSDPLPNSPLVIRSTLPDEFKLSVRKALIEAPSGLGLVGGEQASGYTSVADEDYEPIRRIQQTLGLDN
ncbi:phosphate/phosphite/phosphonate ABC transporter substrate-binding protein [Roseofilum capinflatum]|uniref:Phosphate/phosphite/phosphonate ABC transporter substrate-binding protein n=1 Tax=Roseofilum capinflatum BLCC-M114 TaxID=3022440 RepID=A0ABT7B9X2_9CYAN|nr:phosphate/phosphite/phosphonate ABC transporter substrate-binding protein [Roseofilum capinflatum]MDJ1175311.1 phosphate/phosphite/phosphonate ABC transporter substrate-binding protein [Roseofilum capinflatum BLCC-M114]